MSTKHQRQRAKWRATKRNLNDLSLLIGLGLTGFGVYALFGGGSFVAVFFIFVGLLELADGFGFARRGYRPKEQGGIPAGRRPFPGMTWEETRHEFEERIKKEEA